MRREHCLFLAESFVLRGADKLEQQKQNVAAQLKVAAATGQAATVQGPCTETGVTLQIALSAPGYDTAGRDLNENNLHRRTLFCRKAYNCP